MAIQVEDKTDTNPNMAKVLVESICHAQGETKEDFQKIVGALVNTLHPKEAFTMLDEMLGENALMLSVETKGAQRMGDIILSLLFAVLCDAVELSLGKRIAGKEYGPTEAWVDKHINGGGN